MKPTITYEAAPAEPDLELLGSGIAHYDAPIVGASDRIYLTYFARDDAGTIVGGIHGNTEREWLYISTLWVAATIRGGGCGRALLAHAERTARERGCTHAYLDTFSYQAPAFYQRCGYTIFAELEDFPAPHRRIFLKKPL